MIPFLAGALVFAGAAVMAAALVPVRRLMARLPSGSVRNNWYGMTGLIVVFLAGYLGYAGAFWNSHAALRDLIVPGVFFLGAVFVWLATTLSLQTAIDVRRISLLERETITDPLTGIYNRRHLDRRIGEEVARAQRYGLPLCVLMLDIDHFKRVNDEHGHQAGDRVLGAIGELTAAAVRESDIAARYGGEEFLVIVPNTPVSNATVLAERLRKRVESHGFVLTDEPGGQQEIRVTVSIGVASLGDGVDSGEKLVHAADEALYRAKHEGRNRVVVGTSGDPAMTTP